MSAHNPLILHLGIAEQGKLLALKGDHQGALTHFREALRMAVSSQAPELFFRHYTQCVIESLEHMSAHQEVIDYCEKALEHYDGIEAQDREHLAKDRASFHERLGVQYLKLEDGEAARTELQKALNLTASPLAQELLDWIARGWTITRQRLQQALQKHHYFVVRSDQVDPKRAIPLPQNLAGGGAGGVSL